MRLYFHAKYFDLYKTHQPQPPHTHTHIFSLSFSLNLDPWDSVFVLLIPYSLLSYLFFSINIFLLFWIYFGICLLYLYICLEVESMRERLKVVEKNHFLSIFKNITKHLKILSISNNIFKWKINEGLRRIFF